MSSFSFSLYGLLLGIGFVVFWSLFEAALQPSLPGKRHARSLFFALVLAALGAVVGARAYHLWTDWPLYATEPWTSWIAIWNGGLGIYGALLGGLLGLAIWKRLFAPKVTWLLLVDAAAFGVPLGQAIGRWGNFVNKELFGLPSDLPWAIHIPAQQRPFEFLEYSTFHPLFLYESIAMILVGGFFVLLWKKYSSLFPFGTGWFLGSYLFAYGSIRFCLELLRVESAPGWLSLSVAQWVSLAATILGLLLFFRTFRLQWKGDEVTPPAKIARPLPAAVSAVGNRGIRTRGPRRRKSTRSVRSTRSRPKSN